MGVKKEKDYIFNLMDALRAPVLTHSQAWADTIPDRLINVIPLARLASLMMEEQTATVPEALAYIYTMVLEGPISNEWTNIYLYLGCKVGEDYWKEDKWKAMEAPRKLDNYTKKQLLNPLRRKIYEKRRKILKDKLKQLLKKQVIDEEKNSPGKPVILGTQLLLF